MGGALRQTFESGRYQQVLHDSQDGLVASGHDDVVAIVGAFSFLGRLDEATATLGNSESGLGASDLARCSMFIGMNSARQMRYQDAVPYFINNMRAARASDDAQLKMCAHLGWAFWRLCRGRPIKAMVSTKNALSCAAAAKDVYLKVLALDLKAHCFHRMGFPCEAHQAFAQALKASAPLGEGGIRRAIEASYAIHNSRFGYGEDPHIDLEQCLGSDDGEDCYTKARVIMELARRHILRGEVDQSDHYVSSGFQLVYSYDQPWFTLHLNLVKAHICLLRGEGESAQQFLSNARQLWAHNKDNQVGLELFGMLKRVAIQLKDDALLGEAESQLKKLASLGKDPIGNRINFRQSLISQVKQKFGQDPIGDLIDAVDRKEPDVAAKIDRSGLHGLFYRLYDVSVDENVAVVDMKLKKLLMFERGNVKLAPMPQSATMVDAFSFLSKKSRTKEEMVAHLWGYQYHSLRHDPLVYRLIARMRDLLGNKSDWLERTEEGYYLRAKVVCPPRHVQFDHDSEDEPHTPHVTSRPKMILQLAAEQPELTTRLVAQRLGVAEITARRDLLDLVKKSELVRVGNGRSTQYRLNIGSKGEK